MITCRAGAAADTFELLYHLKGFNLDVPKNKLSVATANNILWLMDLEQLTLTHTSLPEAGMLGCSAATRDTCLAAIHKVGQ